MTVKQKLNICLSECIKLANLSPVTEVEVIESKIEPETVQETKPTPIIEETNKPKRVVDRSGMNF